MEITGRGDNASLLVLPKQLQSFLISHWRKVRVCCLVQFLTNPLPPTPQDSSQAGKLGLVRWQGPCQKSMEAGPKEGSGEKNQVQGPVLQLPRWQAEGTGLASSSFSSGQIGLLSQEQVAFTKLTHKTHVLQPLAQMWHLRGRAWEQETQQ